MARLKGLGQLRNPMTSSGIDTATFRLVETVPQPTTLPRALSYIDIKIIKRMFYSNSEQLTASVV
jgi:hypothetical protein